MTGNISYPDRRMLTKIGLCAAFYNQNSDIFLLPIDGTEGDFIIKEDDCLLPLMKYICCMRNHAYIFLIVLTLGYDWEQTLEQW